MSSLWMVMAVKKKAKVRVRDMHPDLEQDIDLIFADGMVGAMPVFESKEAAEKCANGDEVLEVVTE